MMERNPSFWGCFFVDGDDYHDLIGNLINKQKNYQVTKWIHHCWQSFFPSKQSWSAASVASCCVNLQPA